MAGVCKQWFYTNALDIMADMFALMKSRNGLHILSKTLVFECRRQVRKSRGIYSITVLCHPTTEGALSKIQWSRIFFLAQNVRTLYSFSWYLSVTRPLGRLRRRKTGSRSSSVFKTFWISNKTSVQNFCIFAHSPHHRSGSNGPTPQGHSGTVVNCDTWLPTGFRSQLWKERHHYSSTWPGHGQLLQIRKE